MRHVLINALPKLKSASDILNLRPVINEISLSIIGIVPKPGIVSLVLRKQEMTYRLGPWLIIS